MSVSVCVLRKSTALVVLFHSNLIALRRSRGVDRSSRFNRSQQAPRGAKRLEECGSLVFTIVRLLRLIFFLLSFPSFFLLLSQNTFDLNSFFFFSFFLCLCVSDCMRRISKSLLCCTKSLLIPVRASFYFHSIFFFFFLFVFPIIKSRWWRADKTRA